MLINNFIYFYIAICVLIIVFELLWMQYVKIQKIKSRKLKIKFKKEILDFEKGKIQEVNVKELVKKLKKVNNLLAFQNAYEELSEKNLCKNYKRELLPVYIELCPYYSRKLNNMDKAYFAYVLGKNLSKEEAKIISVTIRVLNRFIENKSIHCRINALNAICSIGTINNVINAVQIMNKNNIACNSILVANCFENYNGSKKQLAEELFKILDKCIESIQISIIMFLTTYPYIPEIKLIEKIEQSNISVNVKCEIMRYFQVNKSDYMQEFLIDFLSDDKLDANDLTIKAIGVLGYYNSPEIYRLLEKLKNNKNEIITETVYKSLEKIEKNKSLIRV